MLNSVPPIVATTDLIPDESETFAPINKTSVSPSDGFSIASGLILTFSIAGGVVSGGSDGVSFFYIRAPAQLPASF